jgi:hypothetical protein
VQRSTKLALGGAGAIGLLLLVTRSKTSTGIAGDLRVNASDIDALARMLVVEHVSGAPEEKAQIVQVALNRARKLGVSPESVVEPGTRKARVGVQGGTWNGSDNYRNKYARASSDSRFEGAKAFVREVLAGRYENRSFTAFIHPSGMPEPPCAFNRVSVDTFVGRRCMPEWGAKPSAKIGIAYFYA